MKNSKIEEIYQLNLTKESKGLFFEIVNINKVQLCKKNVLVDTRECKTNFISVGSNILSICGKFLFDLKKMESSCLVTNEPKRFIVCNFEDGVQAKFFLRDEQSEKFEQLCMAVLGDQLDSYGVAMGDYICPCCKQKEKHIKSNTLEHPVSQIVRSVADSGKKLHVVVAEGAASCSVQLFIRHLRFVEGIIALSDEAHIELPAYKVHGLFIRHEQIDGCKFSKLSITDTHARELFSIAVEGADDLAKWRGLIEESSYFKSA